MADQFYESVIGFSIGGNYAAVVHDWVADDGGGESPFQAAMNLAEALETDAIPDTLFDCICAVMANDCFISSVRTRRLSSGGGATYAKLFAGVAFPGTFGGNSDAAQVAGCMLKFTAVNPKRQGRTFWPGVSEDALIDGRFVDAYHTAFLDLMNRYLDTFTANGQTFTCRLKHGSPPSYTAISACELSPTPGTIRRRLVPV